MTTPASSDPAFLGAVASVLPSLLPLPAQRANLAYGVAQEYIALLARRDAVVREPMIYHLTILAAFRRIGWATCEATRRRMAAIAQEVVNAERAKRGDVPR